jgi:uncharacterized protein (TIGR01440 family)
LNIKGEMAMINLEEIKENLEIAIKDLLEAANLKPKNILVVGCSTSEILGQKIGTASSMELAQVIFETIFPHVQNNSLFLAAQCCEHLNRALVVERECAEMYNLEEVTVLPDLHAGGAFSVYAYNHFKDPVMVEKIQAHAGIDIGDTFIGMHLKMVVVPVRSKVKQIGFAHLTMARTRPKLIGGERAKYPQYRRK